MEDTELPPYGIEGAPETPPATPMVLGEGWQLPASMVPDAISIVEFFTVYADLFRPIDTYFSWGACVCEGVHGVGCMASWCLSDLFRPVDNYLSRRTCGWGGLYVFRAYGPCSFTLCTLKITAVIR